MKKPDYSINSIEAQRFIDGLTSPVDLHPGDKAKVEALEAQRDEINRQVDSARQSGMEFAVTWQAQLNGIASLRAQLRTAESQVAQIRARITQEMADLRRSIGNKDLDAEGNARSAAIQTLSLELLEETVKTLTKDVKDAEAYTRGFGNHHRIPSSLWPADFQPGQEGAE